MRPCSPRWLSMTLVALVFLASFGVNTSAQEATPGDYPPFRFDEPVSLTLMTNVNSDEAGPPSEDWAWYQRVRDELNVDVQIEWITNDDRYTSTLRTRAATNDLPDVFQTDVATTALLADQGLVGDWTPLYQYMPTYARDRNVEALAPIGTVDGQQYGLVTRNPTPFKGVMAIRGDWLETLGLEAPTTTDEFLAVAEAFTIQDPDGNGAADTYGFSTSINFEGFISGFNGMQGAFGDLAPWTVVEGRLVNRAATEEHRQDLEFVSQLSAAGVMDPDWVSQEANDARTKWKAGRIGIVFEDWCATFCIQGYSEFKGANPGGRLEVIEPPVGPGGASSAGPSTEAGPQYGISQQAIDEGRGEAVARLLEWMNGPGYIPTAFGEEGLSYERDANGGIIQGTDIETFPYRQLVTWANRGTPDEWRIRYGSVETYDDGDVIDVYAILERCGNYPVTDITQWAAIPPPSPAVYSDFIRTQAEAEYAFMTGARPMEEWETHVETLNTVGLVEWTELAEARAREQGII